MFKRLHFIHQKSNEPLQKLSHENIVSEAKARLITTNDTPINHLPSHGERWNAYAQRIRASIDPLTTPIEVLQYAQTKVGFEHRGIIHHEGKFTALYERELAISFPHFVDYLTDFTDINDSAPDTTYEHKGRLISNVLFYLARIVMSCLTYLPVAPKIILEVGGGYGAPARTWMKNPIARPKCYLILDMPESLFFADVFLNKEFSDDKFFYKFILSDDIFFYFIFYHSQCILYMAKCWIEHRKYQIMNMLIIDFLFFLQKSCAIHRVNP